MYLRETTNDYGRQVSEFKCEACGRVFTVCPAVSPKGREQWAGCLADECPSYDIGRDVEMIVALGEGEITLEPNPEGGD